eukprot:GEMP01031812.1.p1 GENE.GEMP01031812.1~~GEMP01031812.1.p1  ORF type:complete len:205 (+),score=33.04 GEMP01031812.1:546-1160(+)
MVDNNGVEVEHTNGVKPHLADEAEAEHKVSRSIALSEEDSDRWFSPGFHLIMFSIGMYGISLSWFKNYAGFLYIPWMMIALYGLTVIYYHWCCTIAPPTTEATGFRVPLMPFPSIFAILINTHLLAGLPGMAFFWTFLLCGIAFAFYHFYGRHNSLVRTRAKSSGIYDDVATHSETLPSRPSLSFFNTTLSSVSLEGQEKAGAV